jgi:hypothetical protein
MHHGLKKDGSNDAQPEVAYNTGSRGCLSYRGGDPAPTSNTVQQRPVARNLILSYHPVVRGGTLSYRQW